MSSLWSSLMQHVCGGDALGAAAGGAGGWPAAGTGLLPVQCLQSFQAPCQPHHFGLALLLQSFVVGLGLHAGLPLCPDGLENSKAD